ncbi:hypothetical protein EDD17DRAFT_1762963 [Pisolithus thermaeus]|nr:hypothetical protein EV401DRAFT_1900813 [Pisolithus croceorrhizus]KAI6159034.1 hypothetical protein EDD17DRAFT_1762963 [Pisolithus thermaeus]
MSTGVSYVNLPFGGGVMRLSTGDSEKDTFDYQDLEFEVLDPVPVYQQEELLKVVDDVLESPESKSALRKAVQDLGDSAYSIEICFNNVADGLRSAQVQGTQAQKKHLQGYVDNWAVHHKGYVQLLWESRRVAGHARVIANDFAGEFLSLMEATDITLIEKKAEISAYRKQLDEDAKKSSDLSQRFDGLRRAVEDFQSDVTGFLKTGRALEAQLQETVREVAEIKQRISQLDVIFSRSIRISLGTAGIALAAIALGVLCPPLSFFPIGIGAWSARIGLAAYRQRKEKQGKLAELKERQMHFEEQTRGLEGMHKIHAILDPLKSDIELIKEKLAVFGQIWQLIHADLNAVEKDLELATTSAGVALFKRRLRRASKAYALLADALYQYETNVHIQRVGNL